MVAAVGDAVAFRFPYSLRSQVGVVESVHYSSPVTVDGLDHEVDESELPMLVVGVLFSGRWLVPAKHVLS